MNSEEYFGPFAGDVWQALSESEKTLKQLEKSTGLTMKEVGMGLGWLAREGKVAINNSNGFHLKFLLK